MMNGLIPIVVEQTGKGERAYDIYSRLLKDRILFVGEPITTETSNLIIAQMLFLQSEDADREINMYVNSPGGLVSATLAVYDTMQFLKCPVSTYCVGEAASGAAVLLAAGAKGKRYALPNAKIMIHQPHGGVAGQASDIEIQAAEIIRLKRRINEILSAHTGQPVSKVEEDSDRDMFFSAADAVKYGLIDKVVTPRPDKVVSAAKARR